MSDTLETPAESTEAPEQSYASYKSERSAPAPDPVDESDESTEESEEQEQAPQSHQREPAPAERRPYRNAVPPDRVQAMIDAKDRQIAELSARLQPQPQHQAPVLEEADEDPDPEKFLREDGTFDAKAYQKAIIKAAEDRAVARVRNENAQSDEVKQIAVVRNEWQSKADEYAAANPEVGAAIDWLKSDDVAPRLGREAQLELLHADPLVSAVLASSEDLMNTMFRGSPAQKIRLIGQIEARIEIQKSQTAQQQQQQKTPRTPTEQFTTKTPVRPGPKGPVEIESTIDSGRDVSYAKYRADRRKAEASKFVRR